MLVSALKLNVGDVVRIMGYGFPLYINWIGIPHIKGKSVQAVLYPAWKDEKGDWHAMTAGFSLSTPLDEKVEKVSE